MSNRRCRALYAIVKAEIFHLPFVLFMILNGPQALSQLREIPDSLSQAWFNSAIGIENAGIINGPEYRMELMGTASHPFLNREEVIGTVEFDNCSYVLPLLYDIYKDEIIAKHPTPSGRVWLIQLDKTRVAQFEIQGHLFKNFSDSYYEIIYESAQFSVLAKRKVEGELTRGLFNYVRYDQYFLFEADRWTPLTSTGGFANLVSATDRKELHSFVKQNKIKRHNFTDHDLMKLGAYVNSLHEKKQ